MDTRKEDKTAPELAALASAAAEFDVTCAPAVNTARQRAHETEALQVSNCMQMLGERVLLMEEAHQRFLTALLAVPGNNGIEILERLLAFAKAELDRIETTPAQ